jgi:hypothetical protein
MEFFIQTWNSTDAYCLYFIYSSTGNFLTENGCQSTDAVTNGAMFKSSPIVQNGSDAYASDLRKSSSGSLAGKIHAAANGYTLGSDVVLRNGNHRNSSTESIKSLNSKNSTFTSNGLISKQSTKEKQLMNDEMPLQNGHHHTLKSLKEQGMLKPAKMQSTLNTTTIPSKDAYSANANGKSNSHHYTESDNSPNSTNNTTNDSHKYKHVDFTSSVTRYVRDQLINKLIHLHE